MNQQFEYGLLQGSPDSDAIIKSISKLDETGPDFTRIRCPLCNWNPRSSDRWACVDCPVPEEFYAGCWTSWNTFETLGKCPGCQYQWRYTACLRCSGFSLHEDWYVKETA